MDKPLFICFQKGDVKGKNLSNQKLDKEKGGPGEKRVGGDPGPQFKVPFIKSFGKARKQPEGGNSHRRGVQEKI